ncbi:MAG: lysine 2,3-aminomutase [Bacteroidetes bacterium HGW-Bacteroidetes-11]|jgi:KamA family protein|nr:MAG: lysine 2,3-aminomutase [Bacteroidetes bacterium HGW-Bacteroidetes-11]
MEYKAYTARNFRSIPQIMALPEAIKSEMEIVARVLPFKSNSYVVEKLINWDNYLNDPIFKLTFPVREMLSASHFSQIENALNALMPEAELHQLCNSIKMEMNPHPAGQLEMNMPVLNGKKLEGVQHKYKETVLFFPSQGQTCHAYCTFCFRWPQFSGLEGMKISANQSDEFVNYLKQQKEVTNVLFTGGDPLVMKTSVLARYIEKLLEPGFEHIHTIRIGSKALAYWPYRFLTDSDSEELLDLFRKVASAGKQLTLMAHFNHPVELSTKAVKHAIRVIRAAGVEIRTQSPVLKNINDSAKIWAKMWRTQVSLGCSPYYMFMARDTGAKQYFDVSIDKAYEIFREAYSKVSGVARTARGPVMSAAPGKVHIVGVSEAAGQKVFVLQFIQARKTDWVKRPFFAKFDPDASWLSDLQPAFEDEKFFWQEEFEAMSHLHLKNAIFQEEE